MKKWLILVGCLLGVLGLLATALVITYHHVLSTNFLVATVEKSINSRVQIGGYRVSLFSVPARVVLEDVILTQRDGMVRKGVAHDDRPALEDGEIRVGEIRFDLSLRELLAREIQVSELRIAGAHFDLRMDEAGDFNIEPLFADPPDRETDESEDEALRAGDDAGFVTELDRLWIVDSSFRLLIEKTGLEVIGRELSFDLSDIRVDPAALETVNEARLDFAARLQAFSARKGRQKYGQLDLKGPARVRLFDPATGVLEPDAEIEFSILPTSYVSTRAPYIERLWQVTDTLRKLGLKKQPLAERMSFGRDRVLHGSYRRNRIGIHQPVSLVMEDWELALDGGSWVEPGSEQHHSKVQLIASRKLSEWVNENLRSLLDKVPADVRGQLHAEFLGQLFVADRLTLKAGTEGPLSDPSVRLETRMPDLQKAIKDYAKTKLFDLLIDQLER